MAIEYVENIVQLLMNLIALLLCLFYYISSKRRGWFYCIAFFLCSLLSCYYWTSYQIIMGVSPNVSDEMTYFGWNASYFVLFILLMHMKTPEERRYFHPLMLLPVPLNIWQLTLYLPYGRLFNNVYSVALCTLLSCFSIHLNHLEIGFKNIIVNDEAVRFGVVANIYIEIIDIVTTFPSVGLMHGISAVGQLL